MNRLIASTLVAFGLTLSAPAGAVPSVASSQPIVGQFDQIITQVHGGHGGGGGGGMGRGHGNSGRHLGWTRGRHYGWGHSHHRRHW